MVKLIQSATEFELSPTLAASEMVAAKRAAGQEVLHMGFGESPFPVPERMQQALQEAADRKEYTPVAGLPNLCEAVKGYYQNQIGLDTDGYDVLVAPGSKLILYALQMAIEGDLLMPVPSWVSYGPQAKMLHTNIVKVPVTLCDEGYLLEPKALKETIDQARAAGQNPTKMILNYPNNPTGLSIPDDRLQGIAKVCEEEGVFVISDEIYSYVTFNNEYRTIAKYAPEMTAVSTGLSKHLSLGGWRVGVGLIPKTVPGLYQLLCSIASETWSCVPAPIQQAAVEAYAGHPDIQKHISDCTDIHAYMNTYIAEGLRAAGIECALPQGAFYTYPNFGSFREGLKEKGVHTSRDLVTFLMQDYSLAALPGVAFGEDDETLTLRLSGCDYDGAAVLAAYQAGETLDEAFIANHAPRVKGAVEVFQNLVASLSQDESLKISGQP